MLYGLSKICKMNYTVTHPNIDINRMKRPVLLILQALQSWMHKSEEQS